MLTPAHRAEEHARPRKVAPALMVAWFLSCYSICLFFFFLCSSAAAASSPIIAGIHLSFAAFVFWGATGLVLETFLATRLIRLMRQHQYFEAERMYITYTNLWRSLPIRKGGRLGLAYSNLGLTRLMQGKFDAAEIPLRESLRWLETDRQLRNHYARAIAVNNLAVVLVNSGELEEAEQLAKKALQIYQDKTKSTSGSAFPLITLGAIYLRQGKPEQAEKNLEKAQFLLDFNKKPYLVMEESIQYARSACALSFALLRCQQGRMAEAKELCEELLSDGRAEYVRSSSLEILAKVARLLMQNGEPALAERMLDRAYEIGSRHPDHSYAPFLLDVYTELLTATGRSEEVADMRRWIRPLMLSMQH